MNRTATQVLQGFYTAAMCADADDARNEYRRLFHSATIEEMQMPAVARRIAAYMNLLVKFEGPAVVEVAAPAFEAAIENGIAVDDVKVVPCHSGGDAQLGAYGEANVIRNGQKIGVVQGGPKRGYWTDSNEFSPLPVRGTANEAVQDLLAAHRAKYGRDGVVPAGAANPASPAHCDSIAPAALCDLVGKCKEFAERQDAYFYEVEIPIAIRPAYQAFMRNKSVYQLAGLRVVFVSDFCWFWQSFMHKAGMPGIDSIIGNATMLEAHCKIGSSYPTFVGYIAHHGTAVLCTTAGQQMDETAGPYCISCNTHDVCGYAHTIHSGRIQMRHPELFCDECREVKKQDK